MTDPAAELVFLPLGGAGEIGMNLNLYGFGPPGRRRWLMIDFGVTFGKSILPGLDVILPDPSFIEARRDRLDGLVLTHAHEDHLGAVPYLWERLGCPVYATPFTASVLRAKMGEDGNGLDLPVTEVAPGQRFAVGPFDLELVQVTHSIPEPNAVVVRTPAGTVLHSGDWKLDPDPVVGPAADEDALARIGDEGVLALVCDSTNVFSPGTSGSEADLQGVLTELIGGCDRRVAVACFATNVARLETIAAAAAANGRDVALAGRSMWRIERAARDNGYLADVPAFLDADDAAALPRDKVVIACTGSQGEPRAALARMAAGDHRRLDLGAGDRVIFSSRVIPGNEMAVGRIHNQLIGRGVEVITWRDHPVHVSGHPARDELMRMYALVRPRVCVPVHGEMRHMTEQARLARACQVPEAVVVENGSVLRLGPEPAAVIDQVPSGRLAVDGGRIVPLDGEVVRARNRVAWNGSAMVTVVVDGSGRLAAEPQLSTVGLLDDGDQDVTGAIRAAICRATETLPPRTRGNDEHLGEAVRVAVRRAFRDSLGKRPVTQVHVVRV